LACYYSSGINIFNQLISLKSREINSLNRQIILLNMLTQTIKPFFSKRSVIKSFWVWNQPEISRNLVLAELHNATNVSELLLRVLEPLWLCVGALQKAFGRLGRAITKVLSFLGISGCFLVWFHIYKWESCCAELDYCGIQESWCDFCLSKV